MMIFARYLQQPHIVVLLGVLLCVTASTTEAFVNQKGQLARARPSDRRSLNPRRSQISILETTSVSSPPITALKQASVPLPGDYFPEEETPSSNPKSVLQKIYQDFVISRRDATAASTLAPKKDSLLKRHPFVFAVAITTVNAVLADVLTQLVFTAGKNAWDWQRTLVFGAFGFLYQGMAQYAIVNGVWEKVFPGTSKRAIVAKICAMNLLSDPILFMPTFYIFQQIMSTGTSLTLLGTVKTALLAYKSNCWMDWRNSWMVWFPGHAVTYGAMPKHKRIPWMAFLSFFYMCVLSMTRG